MALERWSGGESLAWKCQGDGAVRRLLGLRAQESGDTDDVAEPVELPVHYFQSAPCASPLIFLGNTLNAVKLTERMSLSARGRALEAFSHCAVGHNQGMLHLRNVPLLTYSASVIAMLFSQGLEEQKHVGLHHFKMDSDGRPTSSGVVSVKGRLGANMGLQIASSALGVNIITSGDTSVCSGELTPDVTHDIIRLVGAMTKEHMVSVHPLPISVPSHSMYMETVMYRLRRT